MTDEEILNNYIQTWEIQGLTDDQIEQYKDHIKDGGFFQFHLASHRFKESLIKPSLFDRIIMKLINRIL